MARYDLTDEEFALVESLLPPERSGKPGKPYGSHPVALNGIFWVLRSGAAWRDAPERYGPWSSVYDRYRRWKNSGVFQKILDALEARARQADATDFECGAVDGSTVHAHKSAAGARKKRLRRRKAAKHRR